MTHQRLPSFNALLGVLIATNFLTRCPVQAAGLPVDMKVLIISNSGQEPSAYAMEQTLGYLGVPYTLYKESATPGAITASFLSSGSQHGYYYGVVATNDLDVIGLSSAEKQALATYESTFNVRQVTMYLNPVPAYGLNYTSAWADTSQQPLSTTLTSAGLSIFKYLNKNNPVIIKGAVAFLTTPVDSNTTPLFVDSQGHALAAVYNTPDGRQLLSLTFDNNPYLTHSIALGFGLVNWVTHGVFLGERHVYLNAQVDDLFIPNFIYPNNNSTYRLNGKDINALATWELGKWFDPQTPQLMLTLAFNGVGTTSTYFDSGASDSLVSAVTSYGSFFNWVSHTYDHGDLGSMTYAQASAEYTKNIATVGTGSGQVNLTRFSANSLVTPSITGLNASPAMTAAYDAGIRYVVSDTSQPGYNNWAPNTGQYNPLAPGIFMIPRRPNGLYANVGTPDQWIPEYNQYNSGGPYTYSTLLDHESNILLQYLLNGEMDPWMFHQINLQAYDGTHSLIGDLIDATLTKYEAYYNLPVVSTTMDDLGARFIRRTNFANSGVSGTWTPGASITITVANAARVPVTGLRAINAEAYGGQPISYFNLTAGQSVSIPLQTSTDDGAVASLTVVSN